MTRKRQLTPLLFTLMLVATTGFAQQSTGAATNAANGTAAAAEKTAPAQDEATAATNSTDSTTEQDPGDTSATPDAGKDSPFDYRSSEEISEDLSVSFPVDI